jgi:hypothetical protein
MRVIEKKACNGFLLKVNQTGSVTVLRLGHHGVGNKGLDSGIDWKLIIFLKEPPTSRRTLPAPDTTLPAQMNHPKISSSL